MKKLTTLVSGMLLSSSVSIASLSVFALTQGTPASEATLSKSTQTPTPTPTTAPTPAPTPTPTQIPATEINVTDVYKLGHEEKDDTDRGRAGIGDSIVVVVNNLKYLVDRANCTDENVQNKQGRQDQKIV